MAEAVGSKPNFIADCNELSLDPLRPWLVAHTRARHEKKLAECLSQHHISHYLPLVTSVSRAGNRTRYYENPLFPGYVFVSCPCHQTDEIYRSNCVASLIEVYEQEELVLQLRGIKTAFNAAKIVRPCEYIDTGRRVRFVRGPMTGMEALVVRRKKQFRVVLNVEVIRRTVEVETDIEDLELLD